MCFFFFFQAEDGIRDKLVTGVQTCALPISSGGLDYRFAESDWEQLMLVVMQSHASEEQVRAVCERIESLGLKAHPIPGTIRTAIGITGNKGAVDLGVLESLPGVVECIPVSKPYKLVSRDAKEEDSVLRIPT